LKYTIHYVEPQLITVVFLLGGLKKGGNYVRWLITPHTFLSLGWDEWASIVAILTAVALVGRWLISTAKKELLAETNDQLRLLNRNMEIKNRHDEWVDNRLKKGDRKFEENSVRLDDHERRISRLEDEQ
jgi:hypothetical protein